MSSKLIKVVLAFGLLASIGACVAPEAEEEELTPVEPTEELEEGELEEE